MTSTKLLKVKDPLPGASSIQVDHLHQSQNYVAWRTKHFTEHKTTKTEGKP